MQENLNEGTGANQIPRKIWGGKRFVNTGKGEEKKRRDITHERYREGGG